MGDGIGIESRLNLPERFRYERVVRKAKDYRAGDRRVIADLSGPGCVRHFYCVGSRGGSGGDLFNRNRAFIIRFYWDGEEQPSIEVPLADLFGVHHNVGYYPINSFYVTAKANAGLGCYFPMPFARSARVEVEALVDGTFIYTLDWHRYLDGELEEPLRFHASWRRENPAPAWGEDFLVMDALGSGYLAGFSLGVRLRSDEQRWSHAGSENLYLDGEATGEGGVVPHYLRAGGGENTFDAGFGGVTHAPDTGLYSGIPYLEYRDAGPALARHVLSAYRFYVHDLLPFHRSLHFRWGSHRNDMCATAYWYQTEPHRPFVRMALAEHLRYGDWENEVEVPRGTHDLLLPCGASGQDAVPASADDGTWSLHSGDQALHQRPESIGPGIAARACHGFIDFSHVFNVRSTGSNETWPCAAAAVGRLTVERETEATVHLSWDGDLRLRLNDEPPRHLGLRTTYGYQAQRVTLRRGVNTLVIHLDNADSRFSWGAFAFSCRVVCDDAAVIIPAALA